MADVCPLGERLHWDEDDSEALRVGRARMDELTTDPSSLTAKAEQAKARRDIFATGICELVSAARTQHKGIFVVVRIMRLLKGSFAAGEDRANTVEARSS